MSMSIIQWVYQGNLPTDYVPPAAGSRDYEFEKKAASPPQNYPIVSTRREDTAVHRADSSILRAESLVGKFVV